MASPSAPDLTLPQASLSLGGSAFLPVGEVAAEGSLPVSLMSPPSPSRNTRSRAVVSHAGNRSADDTETVQANVVATNKHRKRSSSSTPRKRARSSPHKQQASSPATEDDDEKKPAATESCCICMCDVDCDDLAGISGCLHTFCFSCIERWAERENSCPLCKIRFTKIDRVNKKKKKGQKNSKRVKQRDQRSDLGPGAALEGLLASFAQRHGSAPNIARLIFSGSSFTFGTIHGPRFGRHLLVEDDRHPFVEDNLMFSDSDDETPLSSFIRAFHGVQLPNPVLRPVTVNAHITSRSYATNSNDRNAGSRAENPLEIDDSDDDTVEVVDVVNNASHH